MRFFNTTSFALLALFLGTALASAYKRPKFEVNEVVEAWTKRGWELATISKIHFSGHYDVKFKSGSIGKKWRSNNVRKCTKKYEVIACRGKKVRANTNDGWVEATVEKVHRGGCYDIKFTSGNTGKYWKPWNLMKPVPQPALEAASLRKRIRQQSTTNGAAAAPPAPILKDRTIQYDKKVTWSARGITDKAKVVHSTVIKNQPIKVGTMVRILHKPYRVWDPVNQKYKPDEYVRVKELPDNADRLGKVRSYDINKDFLEVLPWMHSNAGRKSRCTLEKKYFDYSSGEKKEIWNLFRVYSFTMSTSESSEKGQGMGYRYPDLTNTTLEFHWNVEENCYKAQDDNGQPATLKKCNGRAGNLGQIYIDYNGHELTSINFNDEGKRGQESGWYRWWYIQKSNGKDMNRQPRYRFSFKPSTIRHACLYNPCIYRKCKEMHGQAWSVKKAD